MKQMKSQAEAAEPSCPICNSGTKPLFPAQILGKHQAWLHQCPQCGWAGYSHPHWLNEAYQDPIAITDTGLLARNITISQALSSLLVELRLHRLTILDAAGGYGVLTRLMRDIGHPCFWSDPYAPNIFAKGFEVDKAVGSIGVVTVFEVLEHLPNPIEFLSALVDTHQPKLIIASTELYEGNEPSPQWWYLAPETGQHISFYTRETLTFLASEVGLNYRHCRGFHMFVSPECSEAENIAQTRSAGVSLYQAALSRVRRLGVRILGGLEPPTDLASLTWQDHLEAVRRLG